MTITPNRFLSLNVYPGRMHRFFALSACSLGVSLSLTEPLLMQIIAQGLAMSIVICLVINILISGSAPSVFRALSSKLNEGEATYLLWLQGKCVTSEGVSSIDVLTRATVANRLHSWFSRVLLFAGMLLSVCNVVTSVSFGHGFSLLVLGIACTYLSISNALVEPSVKLITEKPP